MENKNLLNQQVFIYRNLHKKCWSIRSCATRKVIAHARTFQLEGAEFKVSEAGRQRVISEKRKNVHAGVKGNLKFWSDLRNNTDYCVLGFTDVTYNPYKFHHFVERSSLLPVYNSDLVFGTARGGIFTNGQA
jgi:hypothetical protein